MIMSLLETQLIVSLIYWCSTSTNKVTFLDIVVHSIFTIKDLGYLKYFLDLKIIVKKIEENKNNKGRQKKIKDGIKIIMFLLNYF